MAHSQSARSRGGKARIASRFGRIQERRSIGPTDFGRHALLVELPKLLAQFGGQPTQIGSRRVLPGLLRTFCPGDDSGHCVAVEAPVECELCHDMRGPSTKSAGCPNHARLCKGCSIGYCRDLAHCAGPLDVEIVPQQLDHKDHNGDHNCEKRNHEHHRVDVGKRSLQGLDKPA